MAAKNRRYVLTVILEDPEPDEPALPLKIIKEEIDSALAGSFDTLDVKKITVKREAA